MKHLGNAIASKSHRGRNLLSGRGHGTGNPASEPRATGQPRSLQIFAAALAVAVLCALAPASSAFAAELTARSVTEALFRADRSSPPDFSGKNLSMLDLSGLDFKTARLKGADLYGVDLTTANLTGSDLAGARLDRATAISANFSGADLSGASLRGVTAFTNVLDPNIAEAPKFVGANLRGARIAARLDGADFRNADLTRAVVGPQAPSWGSYQPRTVLNGCNFSGARLKGADLSKTVMQFSNFSGADLSGANLSSSDLSDADLTGANLTGANISKTDFDGARMKGVIGLESAIGLNEAINLARARR